MSWKIEECLKEKIRLWRIWDEKANGCIYLIMEDGDLIFLEPIKASFYEGV